MKKNRNIQIIRALLIIIVVFFHFTYRFGELFNISTIDFFSLKYWGIIGDDCFYILAGFFIVKELKPEFNLKEFYLKKLKRLWPLYIICMTITFIVVNLIGLEGRTTSIFDYFLNAFFINGFIGTKYVDGAYWYLNYLIIFYFFIGIIYKVSSLKYKKNHNLDICKNYIILWLLFTNFLLIISNYLPIFSKLYNLIGGQFLSSFTIGIALYFIVNKKVDIKTIIIILISIFDIIIIHNYIIAIFIVLFIFFVLLGINSRELKLNIISSIGDSSYAIYLLHQNIGYIVLLFLYKLNNNNYRLWLSILVTFIMITICFLVNKLYNYMCGLNRSFKNDKV